MPQATHRFLIIGISDVAISVFHFSRESGIHPDYYDLCHVGLLDRLFAAQKLGFLPADSGLIIE
jgi:hypothetical protein